jgi:hypothetical protein
MGGTRNGELDFFCTCHPVIYICLNYFLCCRVVKLKHGTCKISIAHLPRACYTCQMQFDLLHFMEKICKIALMWEWHAWILWACSDALLVTLRSRLLPKKIIIIRNNKEAQEVFGERHGGGEYQLRHPSEVEGPQHIKFDSISESSIRMLKTNAQVAYRVQIRCSTYVWRDKENNFLIPPASHHYQVRLNRNRWNMWKSIIYQGVALPSFGPLGRVSCWCPLGTCLGFVRWS